jgi:DNA-binding NtrC family response regulator
MVGIGTRVLVLAPADEAALLGVLLDDSGYQPVTARTVDEAMNVVTESAPAAMLVWVQPGDAEGLATLRTLAGRGGTAPVVAVVGGEGAAMRSTLAQFGARATILLVPGSDRESLEPLRQVLESEVREAKRRRLGHAIP